jgi:uncharacterized repeat protein (TIGR01451 family)
VEVKRVLAGLLALVAMAAPPAQGQEGPLETRLEARKVTRAADGRETYAPADAARPGDVIEYAATYRNTGERAIRDLVATLPIPPHTEFVAGSARPAAAHASVDAARFEALPLKRRVSRDGRAVEEAVPLRDYRALRWQVASLAARQSVTFTARVRVVDDPKF